MNRDRSSFLIFALFAACLGVAAGALTVVVVTVVAGK